MSEINFTGEEFTWVASKATPFAHGGNSELYLVSSEEKDNQFALKIITEDRNLSKRRDRFLEEIRIVKEIEDLSGCVDIIDHGFKDDKPFYVMPYYEKGTMADKYLSSEIDHNEIDNIIGDFKKITLIVKHIHDLGLAIRDIKPQNILVNSESLPIISDFGLSLPVDIPDDERLTETDELIGSQGYRPPEWEGKHPDRNHLRGDIWSLGRLLWAFCSSIHPPNNYETLGGGDSHLNKYLDREIANLIQGIVTTCTSQTPESRPNIEELISLTDELIQNIETEKDKDQKRQEKLEPFLKRSSEQVKNSKTVIDAGRADSELNIKIDQLKEARDLIANELREFIPALESHHSDIGSFRVMTRDKDWTNKFKNLNSHENNRLAYSTTLRYDPNDKVVQFGNMSYVMTKFQLGITDNDLFYWSIYSRDQGRHKELFTEEIETKSILLLAKNKVNKIEDFVKEPFLELLLENFK